MEEDLDLEDPRYLDEVGYFLYYEYQKYIRYPVEGSYEKERLINSEVLLREVLAICGLDERWLRDKTVLTIGCGCTGDLASWPALVKVAIDPLLNVYKRLGMLIDDVPGTGRTVYLAHSAEAMPLIDDSVDLVLCRNALDHMHRPAEALAELSRVLKPNGIAFLDVDLGGVPLPDEPTVFSPESLIALVEEHFSVVERKDTDRSHSGNRDSSIRLVLRNKPNKSAQRLDRNEILNRYIKRAEGQ